MVNLNTLAQWFVTREAQSSTSRGWISPSVKFRGYEIKILPVVACAGTLLIFARMLQKYLQSKEPQINRNQSNQGSQGIVPSESVEQSILVYEERLLSQDLTINSLDETIEFAKNFNANYADCSAGWENGRFRSFSDRAWAIGTVAEWRRLLLNSLYVAGNFKKVRVDLTIKKEALELSVAEFKKMLGPILKVPKLGKDVFITIGDREFFPAAIRTCLGEIQSLQELINDCTCNLSNNNSIYLLHAELRVLLGYTEAFPQTLDMANVTVDDLELALAIEIDFTNKSPTANECLRLRDFLEAHHKNFADKWKSLESWFPIDSPDYTPTVGGGRFSIEDSAFKAEMRRLLNYFSQAQTFYFGPSKDGKPMLLPRQKVEELLEQKNAPRAFLKHSQSL